MLLPVFIGGAFLCMHVGLLTWKAGVLGRRKHLTRHAAPLISSVMLSMYTLYIYLCKMTFDVFDCQPSPSASLPEDQYGGATLYFLQADKTPCQFVSESDGAHVGGGTQVILLGPAIASIIIYIVGYPLALGWFLRKNRELIIEDQLLRAKGVGNDRLTNPNAYSLRRNFSGVYYLWKPDYYWWTTMILLRKFFIVSAAERPGRPT
jgi:hypothetical protein